MRSPLSNPVLAYSLSKEGYRSTTPERAAKTAVYTPISVVQGRSTHAFRLRRGSVIVVERPTIGGRGEGVEPNLENWSFSKSGNLSPISVIRAFLVITCRGRNKNSSVHRVLCQVNRREDLLSALDTPCCPDRCCDSQRIRCTRTALVFPVPRTGFPCSPQKIPCSTKQIPCSVA